jgi:hypothetical protein
VLPGKTKKVYLAFGLSALLFTAILGYTALGPFVTLYNIKEGVEKKDSKRLNTYIDFESLRISAKKQVQKNISQSLGVDLTEAETSKNPLTALMYRFADQLIETAVNNAVSPTGIALLLAGDGIDLKPQAMLAPRLPDNSKGQEDEAASESAVEQKQKERQNTVKKETQKNKQQQASFLDWLKASEFHYESHRKFSVFLYDKNHNKTQLLLIRDGIRWRLSDVIFE